MNWRNNETLCPQMCVFCLGERFLVMDRDIPGLFKQKRGKIIFFHGTKRLIQCGNILCLTSTKKTARMLSHPTSVCLFL